MASIALNPKIIGTTYFLLTYAPERIRLPLINLISNRCGASGTSQILKVVKYLAIFAFIKRLNEKLNAYALNNWFWKSSRSKWTWNQEIAVVTGGCSGIGKAIVYGFLEKDIKVAVLDIAPPPTEFAKRRRIFYINCDITSSASIAEAASQIRKELGNPTILINNAGVAGLHSILDTPSNEWVSKLFHVNIISHFWLIKEFLPDMVRQNKGHIVGMASMSSFVTPPGIVDYAATKASVLALHEGLSQEIKHVYKSPGILNSVVHPSWVRTDLVGGHEEALENSYGKLISPVVIANKVCDQIFSCRGGQLIIPSRVQLVMTTLRGWPNWLQELFRDAVLGKPAVKQIVFQWSEAKKLN